MNVRHLLAFLWLRWRIRVNQFKKAGLANKVVMAILVPFIVVLPIVLFILLFFVGMYFLPQWPPLAIVLTWDILSVVFLFWWCVGLLAELQRSEALSLTKFLHLPVSLKGVFLVNYLGSLVNLTVVMFMPALAGLAVGMMLSYGPAMLVVALLVPAFFLMVTALTYQFQGWLASLMVNKRRRRTIIVIATMTFVLLAQAPNLINFFRPWEGEGDSSFRTRISKERTENKRLLAEGKITLEQFQESRDKLDEEKKKHNEQWRNEIEGQVEQIAWIANLVLPVGWLAFGAWNAADGNALPGLLGALGMGLIGFASLRRSYRTTVRLYTGEFTSGKVRSGVACLRGPSGQAESVQTPDGPRKHGTQSTAQPAYFLERRIPWLSEPATAIALSSMRSLMRASPEAKMMLLTPVILVLIFGSMAFSKSDSIPQVIRPFLAYAGLGMVLFGTVQILGNQFGFDRSGFRVFVMCSAPRREILLGKNLAFVPLALILAMGVLLVIQLIQPLRFDDFVATIPQGISMYLVFCLMANFLSIFAPLPIAAGSLKPANPKLIPILLQLGFLFLVPIAQAPIVLPILVQMLLEATQVTDGWPINLVFSLLVCVVLVFTYRLVLNWQGNLLQSREQKILEVVTTKSE